MKIIQLKMYSFTKLILSFHNLRLFSPLYEIFSKYSLPTYADKQTLSTGMVIKIICYMKIKLI